MREGGAGGNVDEIGIEGAKPPFNAAFEPGFADGHMLQFDAQLQARQFQVPMQFDGIIYDQDLWNAKGQILVLCLKKCFNMGFVEKGIQQALHDDAVGRWVETNKDPKRVAGIFVANGCKSWSSDGEAIGGIDNEKIKLREVKFSPLVGASWEWCFR